MASEGSRVNCAAAFAVLAGLMILMVALLVLAACTTTTTPHVVSDYERSAQFSTFDNFTLIARPQASIQGALVEQRTYDAIRAELTSKGFTIATTSGIASSRACGQAMMRPVAVLIRACS